MRLSLIVTIILCLVCMCTVAQQKHQPTAKDKLEALVFNAVEQVPEVNVFMKQANHHQLIIDDEPHKGFKYYVVKMGYGGDMFMTLERFCIDPKNMQVYYWDTMADDVDFSYSAIITLEKWRIFKKLPLWNKPHTYKAGKLVALTN